MSQPSYLNQMINGAVRTTVVLYPTLKASQHLLEIARRSLNAGLSLIGLEIKLPPVVDRNKDAEWKQATFQSKVYSYVHDYLPKSVTENNDLFRNLEAKDLVKGFAMYTVLATIGIYAANKLVGPMPEVYNTVSKFSGSALRIDLGFDPIQSAVEYVRTR